jgi:hypothetical protein
MAVLSQARPLPEFRSMDQIKLSDALDIMDNKRDKNKNLIGYSVKWVDASGRIIHLKSATKCGLKSGVNRRRYVGLRSTTNNHHAHTVAIHTIIEFNSKRVFI